VRGLPRERHRPLTRLALAIEHDAPVGRAGEFAQHAAGADIVLQIAIGRMQCAGNAAVLLALAGFAQVDEGNVGPPDQRDRLRRVERPK